MNLVYYSRTGNTKRFVEKLDGEPYRIVEGLHINEPFVLVIPTYQEIDRLVLDFLRHYGNYLEGVIGTGNRNFGPLFCLHAHEIADFYGVQVIAEVEVFGTPEDVDRINKLLKEDLD